MIRIYACSSDAQFCVALKSYCDTLTNSICEMFLSPPPRPHATPTLRRILRCSAPPPPGPTCGVHVAVHQPTLGGHCPTELNITSMHVNSSMSCAYAIRCLKIVIEEPPPRPFLSRHACAFLQHSRRAQPPPAPALPHAADVLPASGLRRKAQAERGRQAKSGHVGRSAARQRGAAPRFLGCLRVLRRRLGLRFLFRGESVGARISAWEGLQGIAADPRLRAAEP